MSTTEAVAATEADERLAYRGVFQRMLVRPEVGAVMGALTIWALFWGVSGTFGKTGGTASILDVASSPLGIMAVAVAMLMIGGEFDLSSGAATGALGILTILMVRDIAGDSGGWGLSLWWAIPLSLCGALLLGWVNGTLVDRTGLPSFIVTLASFFVLRGAKLGFSKQEVSQIEVGKLNELAINAEANDVGDRGYAFFNRLFAAEWERNIHIWNSRDWVYTIGVVAGLALLVLAVYEMHFRRRDSLNPVGLAGLVGGIVLTALGAWRLHATDSVGGNWLGAGLIGAGMLVGLLGWATWRYRSSRSLSEALDETADAADDFGSVDSVMTPLAGGIAALVVSVLIAIGFDADNGTDLTAELGIGGWAMALIALVVAVVMGSVVATRNIADSFSGWVGALMESVLGSARGRFLTAGGVWFLFTMLFLNQATEQGARAILFLLFAALGAIGMLIAVNRGRRTRQALGSALLALTAVLTLAMAFFVRSQSETPKFRTQAFSVMLAIAAVMAIWAIATMMFEQRRAPDRSADRAGTALAIAGVVVLAIGVVARLLWVTDDELAAEITRTKYSVRTIWFLGTTAVLAWVLGRTKFGSWTFAVGGNKQAARQVGVPATRTKTQLFMLVSAAAWLVGLLLAFRLNTIQASTGDGEEFEYIIAAVVGGTALTGGYGSVIGASIGAFIMAMAIQGIPAARWNSDWRFVFVGAILLLAVIANNFIRTKAEASR